MAGWPQRIVAVLLPALLTLAWGAWMNVREEVPPGKHLRTLNQSIADDPDVVVIGNSMVLRGVDPAALAKGLGLPAGQAATAWLPGTHAPS